MPIITTTTRINKGQVQYIQCTMDDGSIWQCDENGANWIQIQPDTVTLQERFDGREV